MRTKRITKRLLILLTLLSAIIVTSLVIVVAQATPPSASGSGHNDRAAVLLTFSATEHTTPGDLVPHYTGIAKERDLVTGTTLTIDIDCLQVTGNVAIMSGPLLAAPDGIPLGIDMMFAVVDNGEGDNARPDLFSRFQPLPKGGCTTAKIGFPTIEDQTGNIQVRGSTVNCPVGTRLCCGVCTDAEACPAECVPK